MAWAVSCAGVVATDLILARAVAERPARPLPCVAPPPPASEKRRSRLGLFLPWIALVLVVAAWEALGIDTGEKVPHLTISALALAYRGVRPAVREEEGVAFFVAVAVAALLIDLVARQSGRFASGEDVLRLLLGPPIARIACGAAWAYAGWHLFAH